MSGFSLYKVTKKKPLAQAGLSENNINSTADIKKLSVITTNNLLTLNLIP
jgi:hypothetical protein